MKFVGYFGSLFSALFRRSRIDEDMDAELRSHIQARADDLERSGWARAEAERRARIEFGGQERFKEECRESLGIHFIETLVQDLRFGLRVLRKSPGFTTVAVLTLSLGIGANTAIFSLVNAVMLRLLPVQKPQELVQLKLLNPATGNANQDLTNPLWEQIRDHQDIFSSVLAWNTTQFDLAQGGAVHYITGVFASGNYFNALGVRPAAGRLFTSADDQRGCPALAVLSYGFWQEHYGGAQNAIGSTLILNNHPFQIIGVSSPGFYGMEVGNKFDASIPVCSAALFDGKESRLNIRDWWWLSIIGRLKSGITSQQLKARLEAISPQFLQNTLPPNWDPDSQQSYLRRVVVSVPAATGISDLRADFGQPLKILMGVVGLVLLIASANLASLMLARATSRNQEVAIRKALGASRGRLVRQLMTECLLLSFAGTALGLWFARWGSVLLVRYISTGQNIIFLDVSPDGRVLVFTVGIALLTTFLFGMLPALRSTRVSLTAAMKGAARPGTEYRAAFRPGRWMVIAQVAFSLVLLVVAGLSLRGLVKLITLDIGFDRNNVLIVAANLKSAGILPEQQLAIYDAIEERLRLLPGVVSAGRSTHIPVTDGEWSQLVEVDRPNSPQPNAGDVLFNCVSPGYFQTLRTPVLAGRDFKASDSKTSAPVAIVNQTFARKFFGTTNPVTESFKRVEVGGKRTVIQIVGLARDSKYVTVWEDTLPQAFFPASQVPEEEASEYFELRSESRLSRLTSSVQNAVAQVNKAIPLDFYTLAQQVDDSMVLQRIMATLSSFFASLALLLAAIGLYGALSYLVTQRRSEFGIRMALGAPRAAIFSLVMREVVMILLVGAAAGITIALAAVSVLHKLHMTALPPNLQEVDGASFFGLTTHDAATIIGAIVVLSIAALVAGYLPARRAMRVDPTVALRYE